MVDNGQSDAGNEQNKTNLAFAHRRHLLQLSLVALVFAIWAIVNQVLNRNLRDRLNSIEASSAMAIDSVRDASENFKRQFLRERQWRDSLECILKPMEVYRPLVGMLNYRDSVQSSLPFVPGDRVFVLPDSTPAIVKQVLLTGSGNSFSVDYQVVMKGGVERSIPAILMEKK